MANATRRRELVYRVPRMWELPLVAVLTVACFVASITVGRWLTFLLGWMLGALLVSISYRTLLVADREDPSE